jgi:hypothetical protein
VVEMPYSTSNSMQIGSTFVNGNSEQSIQTIETKTNKTKTKKTKKKMKHPITTAKEPECSAA